MERCTKLEAVYLDREITKARGIVDAACLLILDSRGLDPGTHSIVIDDGFPCISEVGSGSSASDEAGSLDEEDDA